MGFIEELQMVIYCQIRIKLKVGQQKKKKKKVKTFFFAKFNLAAILAKTVDMPRLPYKLVH